MYFFIFNVFPVGIISAISHMRTRFRMIFTLHSSDFRKPIATGFRN